MAHGLQSVYAGPSGLSGLPAASHLTGCRLASKRSGHFAALVAEQFGGFQRPPGNGAL